MGAAPDFLRKKFKTLQDKTLRNSLACRIAREFPRIGGPRILGVCADVILEVLREHLRPRDHLQHGQILWSAIAIDDPPGRNKPLTRTRLVPVVLDLSVSEDIDRRISRLSATECLRHKAVRLCEQAYHQGGLLSNCDLAELLNTSDSTVSAALTEHERTTEKVVPRRATIHDVGTGLTHKRIICLKRYRDGKESHVIAKESWHSLDAVDRYLGAFDRVRNCRKLGLTPEQTAQTLNCTLNLVREYLEIDRELEEARR